MHTDVHFRIFLTGLWFDKLMTFNPHLLKSHFLTIPKLARWPATPPFSHHDNSKGPIEKGPVKILFL